jgi:eukaryotic-like serine/threonine-protein kinase
MPSEPTVLADRYQLLRRLGAGPVGEVWEGRDLVLDQPVAVKVVHGHLAADEAFRARLRSLARDAARVQHPNAVGIHDVDSDGRFVVTELVQGPSTRRLLAQRGTLSPETAMRLAAGVCSALSAAHAAGVLHRNLKPENLLVAPDGSVKVTDFCLAPAESGPGPAAVRYLSPEELATGQVDDRSDLYALGCCLYELVCGRPPFDGPTPFAVASAHVNERPRQPRSIRPDIPEELEAAIARSLAKHPNNRFQTPAELRQALQQAGRPRPTSLTPAPAARTPATPEPHPPAPATPEPHLATPATPEPHPPAPATPDRHPPGAGAPEREGSRQAGGAFAAVHTPGTAVDGAPPERHRLLAALLAVGLVAGVVAVVVAARPSRVTPSPVAATSASTPQRPASAVSPATSPPQLVPVVAGATRAEAIERLHDAGMPPDTIRRVRNGKVPDGHAIGTRPPAGEALRPGERVTLVLSTGAGPDSVADLVALIDANPRAAGPRAPKFRGRLAGLDRLEGRRGQAELADLLGIAKAGAGNGDFTPSFSAAVVEVLGPRVGLPELIALTDLYPEATGPRGPRFGGRLARLDSLEGRRGQAELADLLGIAKAGAGNGDFTPSFSAAAVQVLRPLA